MKKKLTNRRSVLARCGIIVGLALAVLVRAIPAGLAAGPNPNPRILPPGSTPHGMTYGEWSARWWQWALSLPVDQHPLFDTADCSEGQSGKVWFLGGTFTSSELEQGVVVGIADRDCTVPVGKALFFPIVNVEASTVEGNGETKEALLENSKFLMDHANDLQCEIDDVSIQNLQRYRVQSQ